MNQATDMNMVAELVRQWAKDQRDINRVYFFGSRIWGKPRVDSDLDIFIVARDSGAGIMCRNKWTDQITQLLAWPPHIFEYFAACPELTTKIKSCGRIVFSRNNSDVDFPDGDDCSDFDPTE